MKNNLHNLSDIKLYLSDKEEIDLKVLNSSLPETITKLNLIIPPNESSIDYFSFNGIKEILRNMLKVESNSEQHDLRNGDVYLKIYFQNSLLYTLPILCIDLYFFKELSFTTNELLKLKIKTDLLVFTKGYGNIEFVKGIDIESVYECFNIPKNHSFDSSVYNQIISQNSIPLKSIEEMYSIQFGLVPIMKLDIRQLFDNPEYSVFKVYKNKIDERKTLFYQYL